MTPRPATAHKDAGRAASPTPPKVSPWRRGVQSMDTVLAGPHTPFWNCASCGEKKNWASRIVCRCGAEAPQHIADKARAAAKREASAGRQSRASSRGQSPRGAAPDASLVKRLKEVEEQLAKVQANSSVVSSNSSEREVEATADASAGVIGSLAGSVVSEEPAEIREMREKVETLQTAIDKLQAAAEVAPSEVLSKLITDHKAEQVSLRAKIAEQKPNHTQVLGLMRQLKKLEAQGKAQELDMAGLKQKAEELQKELERNKAQQEKLTLQQVERSTEEVKVRQAIAQRSMEGADKWDTAATQKALLAKVPGMQLDSLLTAWAQGQSVDNPDHVRQLKPLFDQTLSLAKSLGVGVQESLRLNKAAAGTMDDIEMADVKEDDFALEEKESLELWAKATKEVPDDPAAAEGAIAGRRAAKYQELLQKCLYAKIQAKIQGGVEKRRKKAQGTGSTTPTAPNGAQEAGSKPADGALGANGAPGAGGGNGGSGG